MSKKDKKTERQAYGITVLKAADKRIRRLKKQYEPFIHGNKFWSSSWAVMDYLEHQGLPKKARVMEVGCGFSATAGTASPSASTATSVTRRVNTDSDCFNMTSRPPGADSDSRRANPTR